MRVAVLGLGHMGRAAAILLQESRHEVRAWNRTPGKAEELGPQGIQTAATVEDAVRGADVVLTLLTNDEAVEQVCMGEGSAIASLGSDAVLVDMSTVYPETSRALANATPDGRFVDAPILGGPDALRSHKAKLLVGGRKDVVDRLKPLWKDLSDAYYYTGANGTATTLKLLSNLILVGSTTLLAEAVVTAQRSGITDTVIREVFGQSPAVAPGVRARLEDIVDGDHQGWWSLRLADKDIGLVLKLAEDETVRLPLAATTKKTIREAIDAGYGDLDMAAIVELIRDSVATQANS